mgnify:CR=1 FL=1
MIALVLLVVIVYILNKDYNERRDRLDELERRLNDYYNEREKRLNELNKSVSPKTNSENLDKNNSAKWGDDDLSKQSCFCSKNFGQPDFHCFPKQIRCE